MNTNTHSLVQQLWNYCGVGRARDRGMTLKRLPLLIDPAGPKPQERPMHG